MNLRRILRIKKIEERERARELRDLEEEINKLKEEREGYELQLRAYEKELTDCKDALRLILRQKAMLEKIREIEDHIKRLERARAEALNNLRELKREEKALDILKDKTSKESYAKTLRREFLQVGFIHILKKGLKALLFVVLLAHSQSAVEEKLRSIEAEKETERLKEVKALIERKLRELEEERKRLEALKKRPLSEEEDKEVRKLIKIVSKTPPDEAGAILNEVDPKIAAEILIRLKERQAGQILAAMDPQKAAEVTEIIMRWRKKSGRE
ncbi:MAG TPA: hypothetical protein EYP11_04810 [Aquificaceae bacterium]|nr:hypothetical protein [Aquificaceae bacterium]HIQ31365.1 hypothetical protein [Aquifex aeolicus]